MTVEKEDKKHGVYALLIENSKEKELEIGSLGMVHFSKGYYVYIGSAQRGLKRRIERHYSRNKKLRWHIDYLLNHAKIIDHLSLPLPKKCEEMVALEMQNIFPYIKNFGSSDTHASSHLFYCEEDSIWQKVKELLSKCIDGVEGRT